MRAQTPEIEIQRSISRLLVRALPVYRDRIQVVHECRARVNRISIFDSIRDDSCYVLVPVTGGQCSGT